MRTNSISHPYNLPFLLICDMLQLYRENKMRILTIIIYLLINNVTFANKPENNIDLTNHIRTNILKNGEHQWGDKEIGKESSFNVLRDINYLCYIEQNCSKHRIMMNSKFYNDTWERVFGKAEKDTIGNMISKVYTKIANLDYIPQAKLNTLAYIGQLVNGGDYTITSETQESAATKIREKKKYCIQDAISVSRKYIDRWKLEEFENKVDIATLNCDRNLSIDGKHVFSEKEKDEFGNIEKYTKLVDDAYKNIESNLGFKIHSYFKRSTTNGIAHRIEQAIANQKMSESKANEMIQNWQQELINLNAEYKPQSTNEEGKNVRIFCTKDAHSALPRIVILVFDCKNHTQDEKGMSIQLCEEENLPGIYQEKSFKDVLDSLEASNKDELIIEVNGVYDSTYDYILRMKHLEALKAI